MDSEQNHEHKNDPKDQARNLYFETGLTQAQIAVLVGVSQKTISIWMNEGRWKHIKEAAENAPAVLIEQMTNELSEIHACIAAREPGQRFATMHEAEIRRKILMSLKYFQSKQTTNVHTEVLMNFLTYIQKHNPDDARIISLHADQYLKREKKMTLRPAFQPYSLPGQVELPLPVGITPHSPAQIPPDDKDKPADLDKAA